MTRRSAPVAQPYKSLRFQQTPFGEAGEVVGGVLAAAVLKRNGGWVSWPQLRLLVQQFLGCSVDCND